MSRSPRLATRQSRRRRLLGRLPAIALALSLAGCESSSMLPWPEPGTGGLAERRPSTDVRIDQLSERLMSLVSRNARYYAAADTYEAERLLIQIRRESEGTFGEDAEINIARLKQKMDAIERQLPRHTASGSK
ncbi:hypothetical protein [Azorhizobium sp. AG788]|uniref:hypothetical protein n=1 Tax=Azorhizobium sp. AG788 TaxID=2183897 RepID=UPI003139496F